MQIAGIGLVLLLLLCTSIQAFSTLQRTELARPRTGACIRISVSVSLSSPSPRPILWEIKCFESTRHLSLALYIKTRMTRHCASPPAFVSPKTIACTHHTVLFQLHLFRQKKVIMPLHTQQPRHHLCHHLLSAQSVPADNSCALSSRILPSALSAPLPRR